MKYRLSGSEFPEPAGNLEQPAEGIVNIAHPYLGDILLCTHLMPNIEAVGFDLALAEKQMVLSETRARKQAINISFQLGGSMQSRFAGIKRPLQMTSGVHNLIHLSGDDAGDEHEVDGNQDLSVFQVRVDKEYYVQCLPAGTRWSETAMNRIEKKMPFAAFETSPVITPRMWQLIRGMRYDVESSSLKLLLFQSRLLELLSLQIDQFGSQQIAEKRSDGINADDRQKLHVLKTYLDSHFLSDLSLAQLSRTCCLNEFKMKKGFKAEFGHTVFGYLKTLRMQYAGSLLRDTSWSVDEVADTLGYEYTDAFSKAFKQFAGCTPSAYRN